jgi:hypothetical protein
VQIARQPALAAGIAGDLTTLAAFSAETWQQYRRLEESTAPDEEKRAAQRRLVALTLANGAMTILAVKGDLKSLGDSPRLVLDFTGPGRIPIARPVLSDPQLRRRLSMVADPEGFIAHLGALDEAARDRVQSQLSLVALSGQLGSPTVKSVLQGASTEQVLRFLELAHIDQHATQVLFQMRRGTVEADWIRSTVLGSDFARARTLIADHGSKLRAGLTWRQYPSLEALERHLANLEQYEPVYKRGVLESVDVDVPPAGWEILDEKMSQRPRPHPVAGGAWEVSARVRGPNGGRGRFSARYHPKTGEFTLKEAFLEERHTGTPAGPVPTFVTGTATPLSARGTPTVIHMVLYLKTVLTNATRKTVPGIQRIRLETVIHLETLLELNWLRRQYRTGLIKEPPSLAERALITKTSTYRYAESAAIQAGLEPVPSSVHVDPAGADTTRLGDVMDQQLGKLTGTRRAEAVEGQDSLVKAYGFTREDQVVERFDIVFDVRPRMPD